LNLNCEEVPCDEKVGLVMTDDGEHEEASENDGPALVNVHPCDEMDQIVGSEMIDDCEHEEASENDGCSSVNGSGGAG
jgi:hypothetical protein